MPDERITGKPVTDEAIAAWADEAERGYDVETLRRRGRPTLGRGAASVVPVRLDDDLLDALNRRAESEHITRSEAIRAALRAWLSAA